MADGALNLAEMPTDLGSDSNSISKIESLLCRIAAALETKPSEIAPEALKPADLAAVLRISVAKVHEMNAAGLLPSPVYLGDRLPRWPRVEIVAWLVYGAPPRQQWQNERLQRMKQAG